MNTVWLALGSNLGDRSTMLEKAREFLSAHVTLLDLSPCLETQAEYITHQPPFLNQVVKGQTLLDPMPLLNFVKNIEKDLGRKTREQYGPREIDIDILYFNNLVLETDNLCIPHPLIGERRFVLEPLSIIAPDFSCPRSQKTILSMLEALKHAA